LLYLPRYGILERFQTTKVTFKVTKGHWYWYPFIGHIWFPISHHLLATYGPHGLLQRLCEYSVIQIAVTQFSYYKANTKMMIEGTPVGGTH